jgi:polysaccharide chain length determinant protein (PEP-CTERM system associated)
MQQNDGYSVPRRTLDVEDYIDLVRRHRGWIFGPFLFTLVASVVGVYLWPDSYVSQSVVKIVPQQVPVAMVQSAINQQMSDRINSMAQTILSRTTLTTIINSFNLYPRERSRMPIEDVIELMKKKVEIVPVASPAAQNDHVPAFGVQFAYENRFQAQRVVQDLVGRFIDENIRNRSNATFLTTQFMRDELDSSKKELDGFENKVASFRMQNNGRLPDQVDGNIQQLAVLQTQISYLDSQISRANQDKLQLESNVRIFKDQVAALSKTPDAVATAQAAQQQKSPRLADQEREIEGIEKELTALRQHYKDSYPDVQSAIVRLEAARKKRTQIEKEDAEKKVDAAPVAKAVSADTSREARDLDANIRRLESAIEARDLDIQNSQKEMKRATDLIRTYQSRIETVPLGEKQYADLLRDRDLAKERFIDLTQKLQRAEMAQEMEGRKQGETLELLDPASLPSTPAAPKRPMVVGIGATIGLLLGLVLAAGREMKDTSLKNLKDVHAYTKVSVLGSVPLLENDFVVRRRRRLAWLGWTTACLAAIVVMSGSVVYYYVTKA